MNLRRLILILVTGLLSANLWAEIKVARTTIEFQGHRLLINGSKTLDIYFEELKNQADIIVLEVKSEKINAFDRWKLWQKGFREAEVVFDGVLLRSDARMFFVRAPASIEEAWKAVEVKVASHQTHGEPILHYGRLDINTKLKRFYWDFMFGLKGADGGLAARFDLNNGQVSLEGRP